jgi:very-short-patch-repair endonuclease
MAGMKNDFSSNERATAPMREHVRMLRREAGEAERRLWARLRNHGLGVKFRRQHPIGSYVADFFCHQAGLVVLIDGGQNQRDGERPEEALRSRHFEQRGYRVLRLREDAVLKEMETALRSIRDALQVDNGARS